MCMWYMLYVELFVHMHMTLHMWSPRNLPVSIHRHLAFTCVLPRSFLRGFWGSELSPHACVASVFSSWATFPVSLFSSEQGCVETWAFEVSKPSYNHEETGIRLEPMTEEQARERCSLVIYRTADSSPEKVYLPTSLLFSSSFFSRWDLAMWPKLASNQWSSCLQSKVLWLEM